MMTLCAIVLLMLMISHCRLRQARLERQVNDLRRQLHFMTDTAGIDMRTYRQPEAVALTCKAGQTEWAKDLLRQAQARQVRDDSEDA